MVAILGFIGILQQMSTGKYSQKNIYVQIE